jgi:hypothetical protein
MTRLMTSLGFLLLLGKLHRTLLLVQTPDWLVWIWLDACLRRWDV